MDLTAPFKTEVLRPITTWVIPGSIAVAPYVVVVSFYVPQAQAFLVKFGSAAAAILTICVLAAGLILDNIGASIEANLWDRLLLRKYPDHMSNWDNYLKLRIKDEMVAQRYLKNHVMQMKFELSMAPALLIAVVGLLWVNNLYKIWLYRGMVFIVSLMLFGVIYFLWESYTSARVLSQVRASILEAVAAEHVTGAAVPIGRPLSQQ